MLRSKRCSSNSKIKDKLKQKLLLKEDKCYWPILRSRDWESCRQSWTLPSTPTQISQFLGSWECVLSYPPTCPLSLACSWAPQHLLIPLSGNGSIRPITPAWITGTETLPLNRRLGTFCSDIPLLWPAPSVSVLVCVKFALALPRTWREAISFLQTHSLIISQWHQLVSWTRTACAWVRWAEESRSRMKTEKKWASPKSAPKWQCCRLLSPEWSYQLPPSSFQVSQCSS